ncbi:trypsin-like serine peptidase [Congregibacter sp.]|uniref:trypsin-like serine peptidase n=1 Tax=Congregibacter sp. TaxID=2744308 RepID=UPI003F6D4B40
MYSYQNLRFSERLENAQNTREYPREYPRKKLILAPFITETLLIKLHLTLAAVLFIVTAVLRADFVNASERYGTALASVGQLHVPGQRFENGYARHYDEDCSATLITDDERSKSSRFIVSAWHCMEFYRDTSKALTFETAMGEIRTANLITSGGSMYSDWALLSLNAPLPHPAVLAMEEREEMEEKEAADTLLMAGYPRRASSQRKVLETARNCRITGRDDRDTKSNCVLQKGASGGAVFQAGQKIRYLGVISRGDGESQSIYVPLKRFRARISAHLERGRLP